MISKATTELLWMSLGKCMHKCNELCHFAFDRVFKCLYFACMCTHLCICLCVFLFYVCACSQRGNRLCGVLSASTEGDS